MKSLNFKRKEDSYLRYFDETQKRAVKKPFNWDRLIYIMLLFLTLFFIGKFLINSYLYIEGDGQVLFESVDIRHTDDIRIYKFFKKEGDFYLNKQKKILKTMIYLKSPKLLESVKIVLKQ